MQLLSITLLLVAMNFSAILTQPKILTEETERKPVDDLLAPAGVEEGLAPGFTNQFKNRAGSGDSCGFCTVHFC